MGPPSGEPAREAFYWEGGPEGGREKGSKSRPSKGVVTFLGWVKFGEASANYLVRCASSQNVAQLRKIFEIPSSICGNLGSSIFPGQT